MPRRTAPVRPGCTGSGYGDVGSHPPQQHVSDAAYLQKIFLSMEPLRSPPVLDHGQGQRRSHAGQSREVLAACSVYGKGDPEGHALKPVHAFNAAGDAPPPSPDEDHPRPGGRKAPFERGPHLDRRFETRNPGEIPDCDPVLTKDVHPGAGNVSRRGQEMRLPGGRSPAGRPVIRRTRETQAQQDEEQGEACAGPVIPRPCHRSPARRPCGAPGRPAPCTSPR